MNRARKTATVRLLAWLAFAAACERSRPDPATSPTTAVEVASPTRDAGASRHKPLPPAADAAVDVVLAGGPVRPETPERDPQAVGVKLRLTVLPGPAEVHWGRKKLGLAGRNPLEIERVRNSGPLDLVIKAEGFLPYHTRLSTERDDSLVVRLVRPSEARSLLGWRPPGIPGSAPAR